MRSSARGLDVRLRYPILRVSATNGGGVVLESPQGNVSVDKAIIATPAAVAAPIYPDATALESEFLRTPYGSTIALLVVARPDWRVPPPLKDVYAILMPAEEDSGISAIGIVNQKKAGRRRWGASVHHPQHRSSVAAGEPRRRRAREEDSCRGRPLPSGNLDVDPAHLCRSVAPGLAEITRRKKSMRRYRESLDPSARVILAGDYMGFPHADSAAYTGQWAAESLTRA